MNASPGCRTFLISLKRVSKIMFPQTTALSSILLVWIFMISLVEQFLIYSVGLIPSKFYDILGNKNFQYFHKELMSAILYALGIAVVKGVRWFVQQQLYVSCRRLLCGHWHQFYFTHNKYYYYGLENNDKASQQTEFINQEINALCSQYSDLATAVMILPSVIGVYIYFVYLILGWFGPASAVLLVAVSKIFTKIVTPIVLNNALQHETREESFRQYHQRIQHNAESLAFCDAGQCELQRANYRLAKVLEAEEKLYLRQLLLNLIINSFDYLGSIMSYVILFIPVFLSWYDYMEPVQICVLISQSAFLFIYLVSVMNSFLVVWEKMDSFSVNCCNVDEFLLKLEDIKSDINLHKDHSHVDQTGWVLENVTITASESGLIILKDVNLKILPGENMLIVGGKSSGKTSLLRVLRGLWKPSVGHIECSVKPSDVFFLPQVPVFTTGCLKNQITYPKRIPQGSSEEGTLLELLHLVDLEGLLFYSGGLETPVSWDWQSCLSRGQQQALCFIRALYHRPKFLITDSATDALLPSIEAVLIQQCHRLGITLIMTTCNSERLSQYYFKILSLDVAGFLTEHENDCNK